MMHRNNSDTGKAQDWPYNVDYPSQQEIDALVQEAQRMRAKAVGDMLHGLWRRMTRRKHAAPGSLPAKA